MPSIFSARSQTSSDRHPVDLNGRRTTDGYGRPGSRGCRPSLIDGNTAGRRHATQSGAEELSR